MSEIEIAANTVNLISIYLAARNHAWTWITGILGCSLFGVLFFQARLYADVSLQVFFVATSIYGWWHWLYGGVDKSDLVIGRVPRRWLLLYCLAGCLAAGSYGLLLNTFTDASYPFIDSMVLAFSIIAQLLLMNRKLENWSFWILVNMISVPLYLQKELYLTGAIYALFLVNAFWGRLRWHELYHRQSGESV